MKSKIIAALTALAVSAMAVIPAATLPAEAAVVRGNAVLLATSSGNSEENDTDGDGVTDNGFEYSKSGQTAEITGYRGTATALTIPLRISIPAAPSDDKADDKSDSKAQETAADIYDVTSISDRAFAGNAGLTSVTMQGGTTGSGSSSSSGSAASAPVGLGTIGSQAFYGCPALSTVTVPATVENIGDQAFSDCPALTAINVNAGNQRYISKDGVLYRYTGIKNQGNNTYALLQYPSGKTGTEYTVPADISNRLIEVGNGAFAGAQLLTDIVLPESVSSIGSGTFRNCIALKTIAIPTKVSVIPSNAFSGCTALTGVTMSEGVSDIASGAFENCYALESIDLPEAVKRIGDNAFYGCGALKEVTVPYGATAIGEGAFAYCPSLVRITVPATVTTIGNTAFNGTDGVTMYCHSGSQAAAHAQSHKIGTVLTYTVRFVSDTGAQLSAQEVVNGSAATAPDIPDRPGYKLKWSCSFSNVTSDLTVAATYSRAFTVTFIDEYNDKREEVQVEYGRSAKAPSWKMNGYTVKWSRSFSNVTGDMTVYATWKDPATGFVIDGDTIKPAKKGTDLTSGTATYRVTSTDVQNPKVSYVSNSNAELDSVSIPKTVTVDKVTYKVTKIESGAFEAKENLTSVTIGANVTAIGSKAFYNCKNLSKVKIKSKKLSSIGSKAFYGVKNKAMFYAYRSKLKTYQSKLKKSGIKKKTTIRLKAIG